METTENEKTIKLVLPFPHVLWMLGMNLGVPKEKSVLHEQLAEQENINRENIDYEEEK